MAERANVLAKKMDFFLGVPVIALLGVVSGRMFRRHRTISRPLRRVGLLKTSAIGDTVLLSAIAQDIYARDPDLELYVFTGGSNFAAAQIFFPRSHVIRLPMLNPIRAVRMIRQTPLDVLIDFDSWPRVNALLCFFARARETVGFRTAGQFRHVLYGMPIPHSPDAHELDNYRALLKPLGIPVGNLPGVDFQHLPSNARSRTEDAGPLVLFHPWPGGSQAAKKRWPLENWAELARRFHAMGTPVRVTCGPGDRSSCDSLLEICPKGAVQALAPPTLRELALALQAASLVISVDTGVAHMAAALGAPTLALHGPTSPSRWGALGPRVVHLKDAQPARIQLGFEPTEGNGLLFQVSEVFSAALKLLPHPDGSRGAGESRAVERSP